MLRISLPALLLGSVLATTAGATADELSTGRTEARLEPSTASTGTVETSLAPVGPREPIRLELGAEETSRQIEGRTSAATSAFVLWSAPAGRMLSARLSSPGNRARLSVYQPGNDEAEEGTLAEQGAIAWIGIQLGEGELRLEAHTESAEEIPFRIAIEVAPPEGVED